LLAAPQGVADPARADGGPHNPIHTVAANKFAG